MSTRSTIEHSDMFHLYTEAFDDEGVHLEIRNVECEVLVNTRGTRTTIRIPNDIAKIIGTAMTSHVENGESHKEWLKSDEGVAWLNAHPMSAGILFGDEAPDKEEEE